MTKIKEEGFPEFESTMQGAEEYMRVAREDPTSGAHSQVESLRGIISQEPFGLEPWQARSLVDVQDADPRIVDALVELNLKGYQTTWSCSGHGEEPGYIWFGKTPHSVGIKWYPIERKEVRTILKEFGMSGIKFYKGPNYCGLKMVIFDSLDPEEEDGW